MGEDGPGAPDSCLLTIADTKEEENELCNILFIVKMLQFYDVINFHTCCLKISTLCPEPVAVAAAILQL